MARIQLRRRHSLGLDGARAQVEQLRAALEHDLRTQSHWQDDELHFHRTGASGRVTVGEDFIELDLRLGLLLAPLKSGIEQAVNQRLDSILATDETPARG
jgi:putative polyhydroxyalkanoate system protein